METPEGDEIDPEKLKEMIKALESFFSSVDKIREAMEKLAHAALVARLQLDDLRRQQERGHAGE